MIDLRSDTITKPSQKMLDTMIKAEVGDDVLGDDPGIIQLQNKVSKMFGKEAGLFVPSGTMSNQIAIKIHTQPGTEIICDGGAHIYNFEGGAPGFLSGVQIRPIYSQYGILDPAEVENQIRPGDNVHFAPTALIEVENTHNRGGGTLTDIDTISALKKIADKYSLAMHLDGARIWNAHVATGIPFSEYGKYFDTISVCFSKGLGAPVGSMLLGSENHINTGKRYRKIFGGGMRQAGYLAAAAEYGIDNNLERMNEDHANAKLFADIVNSSEHFSVDTTKLHTNIVMIDVSNTKNVADVTATLEKNGVRLLSISPQRLRAVFHLHISQKDAETAANLFKNI